MGDSIAFSGKASSEHGGLKEHGGKFDKGDEVVAIVLGTVRGVTDVATATGGDELKLMVRTGEVLIVEGLEYDQLRKRLYSSRQRRAADAGEGQGEMLDPTDETKPAGADGSNGQPDPEQIGGTVTEIARGIASKADEKAATGRGRRRRGHAPEEAEKPAESASPEPGETPVGTE